MLVDADNPALNSDPVKLESVILLPAPVIVTEKLFEIGFFKFASACTVLLLPDSIVQEVELSVIKVSILDFISANVIEVPESIRPP